MAFRDDLTAAQARAQALQRQVDDLQHENKELRTLLGHGASATPAASRSTGKRALLVLIVGWLAVLAALAALAPIALALAIPLAVMTITGAALTTSLLEVVHPGELLVLSGRTYPGPDGGHKGYRVLTAGRAVRMPFLEVATRMSTAAMATELHVERAFAMDGNPMTVSGRATVRIDTDPRNVENAVERFLGRGTEEIQRVAGEVLTSHLRAVAAHRTLEEMSEQPVATADELRAHSRDDMASLGLVIDEVQLTELTSL